MLIGLRDVDPALSRQSIIHRWRKAVSIGRALLPETFFFLLLVLISD
jgi:hypothetical protein